MNNAKEILAKWLNDGGFSTYKELAKYLGVAQNTLDVWKQRGNIPEKHLLKYTQMTKHSTPTPSSTIPIPKLQCTVSAGGGNHIEGIDTFETNGTLIIDKDTLRVDYKNLRAIKVDGYSMIPVLMPDSWVIFDDTDHFTGDGLYIINFRNILMVKTLQVNSEGKLRIISANKEYESYTIDLDDQSTFKIFGKVRRCII